MLSGDTGSDLTVPGALLIPALLRKPRHSPLLSSSYFSYCSLPLLHPLAVHTHTHSFSLIVLYVEGVLSTGNLASLIKELVDVGKL